MKNIYSLKKSYIECHKIFKKHAKTYYLGALLFDYKKFLYICSFYGFVRIVDDFIDMEDNMDLKTENIKNFKTKFYELYNKDIKTRKKMVKDDAVWENYHPIMRAVIDTINKIDIKREIFEKYFKSMEMDLDKHSYDNYDDLEEYMDGSAAIIGEVMLEIIKYENKSPIYLIPEMKKYARDLGFAFQLTNFLRDIKEDMDMKPSRIYIPKDCQNNKKCILANLNDETQMRGLKNNNEFKELIESELIKCDKIYKSADIGIKNIDNKYRQPIYVAKLLYSEINNKIREKDYDISSRVSISSFQKIKILYKNLGLFKFVQTIVILIVNYIRYNFIY